MSTAAQEGHSSVTADSVTMTGLNDKRCFTPHWGAWPVAALAWAQAVFTVAETTVLALPRRALAAAVPAAPLAAALVDGPVTIRGWLADTCGEAVQVGPIWHNVDAAGAEEAVVELAGIAGRHEDVNRFDRLLMTSQQFVPAEVSARVRVCTGSGEITIRSCWGLDECLEMVFDQDLLVLALRSADVRSHIVAQKPTSVRPADGGTRVVPVPAERRCATTIDCDFGRRLAVGCRRLSEQYGRDTEFGVAVIGDTPYLLTCRPLSAAR